MKNLHEVMKTWKESISLLHDALHGDSAGLSTRYLNERITKLAETIDHVMDGIVKLDTRVAAAEGRLDKASAAFADLRKKVNGGQT